MEDVNRNDEYGETDVNRNGRLLGKQTLTEKNAHDAGTGEEIICVRRIRAFLHHLVLAVRARK